MYDSNTRTISQMVGRQCVTQHRGSGRVLGVNTSTVYTPSGTTHPVIVMLDTGEVICMKLSHVTVLNS